MTLIFKTLNNVLPSSKFAFINPIIETNLLDIQSLTSLQIVWVTLVISILICEVQRPRGHWTFFT